MTKIVILGDVHGKTHIYQKMLRQKFEGVRTIQIGDMGLGFKGVGLPVLPDNHKFFRGNHDDPEKCKMHANYLGKDDFGFLPEDNLFWLAGAYSIDARWRVPGVSWWSGEELSVNQLQAAIDLYKEVKPKYVISHEAPEEAALYMLTVIQPGFRPEKLMKNRTSAALQVMHDAHQPKEWAFGHYHLNKSFDWRGTKFTCVGELSTYELNTDAE